MKTGTVTVLAVGTGVLCVMGLFGIAATADVQNEADYTVSEPQERTAEENIAASQKKNKEITGKHKFQNQKEEEFVPDSDMVADIAWEMISQSDRDSICLAYSIDPVDTLDSARQIWRGQGHSESEVKALSRVVHRNC